VIKRAGSSTSLKLPGKISGNSEPPQAFFSGIFEIVDAALMRHGFLPEPPLKAAA
jgi:hypothetical protein